MKLILLVTLCHIVSGAVVLPARHLVNTERKLVQPAHSPPRALAKRIARRDVGDGNVPLGNSDTISASSSKYIDSKQYSRLASLQRTTIQRENKSAMPSSWPTNITLRYGFPYYHDAPASTHETDGEGEEASEHLDVDRNSWEYISLLRDVHAPPVKHVEREDHSASAGKDEWQVNDEHGDGEKYVHSADRMSEESGDMDESSLLSTSEDEREMINADHSSEIDHTTRLKSHSDDESDKRDNKTQLALMVTKIAKSEHVVTMAAAPCDTVMTWMPSVVRVLEYEIPGFNFLCIDTCETQGLKAAFGDTCVQYANVTATEIEEVLPDGVDLVVSWRGVQAWGITRTWKFFRGLREKHVRLGLFSHNPESRNVDVNGGPLNLRKSPLLFDAPCRVINNVTLDLDTQLVLYNMDELRQGF